ncbi:3-mercaptopyruvate sulfurtransferase [Phenylobacterium sp.]|uniref:3-mercaptopyruvate sulfurtransferase n=1 Tax=Phenylobacterium sp. TaxID=1871053 RepID=UPI0027324415|nr:3-mercaptopyruvate sulfurtransferase [Phenylobacterium sp.]MDP3852659.1 3-mercaptopyruvate sulfurtransferase [Phenylobacterium sp.]
MDPVISTEKLAQRLGSADLRVVDGSWFMPAEGRSGAEEYLRAHIPGAVFFDIDAIADRTTDLPHMLPTPEAFAQAVGALGLSRNVDIVVYDSLGIRAAARVWWSLRAMGFTRVFVLDGGLKKWLAEARNVETGDVHPRAAQVAPAIEAELVRSADDVRGLLASGEARLVDARGAARFRGEAPEPRPGLRSGHMPGAANVPFDQVVAPDGTLRPVEELGAIFEAAGVDLDHPIVTTCGSGVTASVLALALARLGRDRTAVYDGSWSEWGALADAPAVTGP